MIQAELIWSTIIITSPVCVVLFWMIWPKMKSLLKRCFGRYIPSDNLVRNCLLIMAVLLIECLCLEKLANNFIRFADHHLYWIKSNPTNDWIVALTAAALALWLFKQPKLLSYRTFGGFARFLVPACLLLFIGYVIFIHRSECTRFYCYSRFIYLDAPFTLLLLWWVMPLIKGYKSREEKLQKSEDDDTDSLKPLLEPDDSEPKDELGRKEEAERLCHYIIDDKNDYHNTLAVAVRGSWGSGKTTFLNYMKSHLKAQGITFFDYAPWLCESGNVSLHFLQQLDQHLHQQGVGLNSLQMYIRSLSVSNITGWFSMVIHGIRHLMSSGGETLQDDLNTVSRAMGMLNKPVIAFIDDVDRIGKEDFLNVMKLVRMTASFPNLIYVIAYDGTIAGNLLSDYGGDKFLDKIFNVKHDLLHIPEDKMQELTEKKLNSFAEYKNGSNLFEGLMLTDYISTIRELKHFFNLMHKDYMVLNNMRNRCYFNFEFFVKNELLKHYDPYVWTTIKDSPGNFLDVKNEWGDVKAYVVKPDLEKIGNEHTKELLMMMFDSEIAANCEYVCPGGLQMMYPDMYSDDYLSKQEIEEAIKNKQLYTNVCEWIRNGRQGIAFMLSHHLKDISVEEMAKVCEEMIKNRPNDIHQSPIEEMLKPKELGFAAMGQIRNMDTPYNYIEHHHELYLHLQQQIRNGDKNAEDEIKAYAEKTTNPRELMSMIYGMMMSNRDMMFSDDRWTYEVAQILFKKMAEMEPRNDISNQYYFLEALEYMPYFESQYQVLRPLMEEDLGLWLRLTIKYDDTLGNDEVLTANVNVLRSMFDTYEDYLGLTMMLKDHYKNDEDMKAMIDEHRKLVENTSLIGALSFSNFYASKYPHLKAIMYKDPEQLPILHKNFEQTKETLEKQHHPFFENKHKLPMLEFEG